MMETWLTRKLRTLRVRQGLTLVEAAKKTGVTRATLSELERGHRHPVAPTLVKIAEGYGVPVEELIEQPIPFAEAPSPRGEETTAPNVDAVRAHDAEGRTIWAAQDRAQELIRRARVEAAREEGTAEAQAPQEVEYWARAERRERDRFVASSMEGLALQGESIEGELEYALQRPENRILFRLPLIFSHGYSFAGLLYEELVISGEVSEGLKRAKARLDEVNARIENLARRVISLGSDVVIPSALSDARQIEEISVNRRGVSRLQAEAEDRAARTLQAQAEDRATLDIQIEMARQTERGFYVDRS